MPEKGRLEEYRKDKSEERPEKMGVVGDLIRLLFAHVPGIDQITDGEKYSGDRQQTKEIELFPWIQKNEGKKNS